MTSLSVFTLMRPVNFAWCGQWCPVPVGRCAEPFWVRDFSGLGTWSPEIIFIAGDQVSFLISFARAGHFVTCTDASESA